VVTVAIDEGPLHGPRTGVGNAVDWLLRSLDESGSELTLAPYLTSTRATITPPTRRLPLPAAAAHRLWAKASWPKLDRWLGRPDVVHGTNYVVPPTRCPSIVSVYDCWFLDHPGDADPVVARAGEVLTASIGRGTHVATSSQATADRVRDLFDTDRVSVIHLGPPLAPLDEPPAGAASEPAAAPPRLAGLDSAPFVLSLGTLERRKNVPKLLDAFARVAAEHPTVRLVIAGGAGDDAATIDRTIESLDAAVTDRIRRLGRVSDVEKRWLLAEARALAYPSLDEGFGFPILEAQVAGTAVAASSAGSIPEIAGTGALLSPPNDADALAANLHWIVTSDRRHDDLVAKGHANADRFSWTTTSAAYIDLYRKVANDA
jgi:glycosyltransferase involved in cell wall biosynthesis